MDKSIKTLESEGFKVKKKPALKPVDRPVQNPDKPEVKLVGVVENQGVLFETQKTNKVMQMVTAEMVRALRKINEKPKKLVCNNIERDNRGLITSFEISVVE